MRQFICNVSGGIASATRVMSLMGSSTANTTAEIATLTQPWSTAGVMDKLRIVVAAAPGVGNSVTWTVRQNGIDTSLAVTISGAATSGEDTTHSVTLADGDELLLVRTVTGTPTSADQTWTVEFTATAANTSCYSYGPMVLPTSGTRYNGLFTGTGSSTSWLTSTTGAVDIASAAGTLTKLRMRFSFNVLGGGSYTFTIYKNGVAQDGTGGTVDTRCVVNTGTSGGSSSFSLPVAAGDTFYLESVASGTITFQRAASPSCEFVANTPGQSMFHTRSDGTLHNGLTRYVAPTLFQAPVASETGSGAYVRCGVTSFSLLEMWAALDGTPGSGNDYTFTSRLNAATPGGALVVTIADAATAGNVAGGVACVTDGRGAGAFHRRPGAGALRTCACTDHVCASRPCTQPEAIGRTTK